MSRNGTAEPEPTATGRGKFRKNKSDNEARDSVYPTFLIADEVPVRHLNKPVCASNYKNR
ncbi:AAEL006979-PA [Aedes aegypti]|uniref:AAEL006979-PA n=1 Tax=Aedes aegypti TaxID=7159 RepID=Q174A2_AEDAE|nr:AAEL006979-PA [Aedes aegypti]